jgi:hypothetical protein
MTILRWLAAFAIIAGAVPFLVGFVIGAVLGARLRVHDTAEAKAHAPAPRVMFPGPEPRREIRETRTPWPSGPWN